LKSTETGSFISMRCCDINFSNFGSLKSTETAELFYRQYAPEAISAISAR